MTSSSAATRGMHVLAHGGGRSDQRVVAAGERHDQRGGRLGEALGEPVGLGEQHLAHALELGSGLGGGLGALAGDQHVDVGADLEGGRQRLGGLVGEVCVVVFGNQQSGHACLPFPLILKHAGFVLQLVDQLGDRLHLDAGLAAAGSSVFSTLSRGARSAP